MLTVLMATFNGAQTLPKVLDAYTQLHSPEEGWRLLVVDNGSNDGTRELLMSYAGKLPLHYAYEPRRGKNAALNHGLAVALKGPETRLFVFTDDDATPDPDWLLRYADAATQRQGFAIFGGSIVPDWSQAPPPWLLRLVPCGLTYGLTDPEMAEGPVYPGLVWGANMAVRGEVFHQGFRFDESIGPAAGEYAMGGEVSFTRLLDGAGFQSWFCPSARVAHHIRPAQLTSDWVITRARRYGRGACRLAKPGQFPELFGAPRWMLRKYAQELCGLAAALVLRQPERIFQRRWELAYLSGYIREAAAANRGATPRILVTSYSGELGGMELRMLDEARILKRMGYDCVLAAPRFPGDEAWRQSAQDECVEVAELNVPPLLEEWSWRRTNRLRAIAFAAPALRQLKPSLVHIAFCWTLYGASALWLAQRCGIPTVISVHNAFPPVEFNDWQRRLLQRALAGVKGVYSVSDSAMKRFLAIYQQWLPADARLAVIPNCVDTCRFQPSVRRRSAARRQWGIGDDDEVIGCVARLSQQKRPEELLAIFAQLAAIRPRLKLLLVGAGPLESSLRDLAKRLRLSRRVIFAGFQARVENIIPAMDLHLLVSRREGFGIATIEAMACGVPVLATRVPGSEDILQDSAGGILLPLGDTDAAVRTITELLDDRTRREEMGRRGRAEVESRYAVPVVSAQVEAFYEGLV
ncbi:glycosyltransferase [Pseudoduganella sp. OTU4001]|uniref:glycosyltransferase n=1 Tax=Pseudoduganella sp. OTU4001 TaxID=3043854 RepID=UPI00313F10A5